MFSSKNQKWQTPVEVYAALDKEFKFDFDPCPINPKFDGLNVEWGERNFVNPPFGREQPKWIKKGYEEWKKGKLVVFLIPARTDTIAFHKYIYPYAELRFVKGRIKFINPDSNIPKEKWTAAPFPSMIVIFKRHNYNPRQLNLRFPEKQETTKSN